MKENTLPFLVISCLLFLNNNALATNVPIKFRDCAMTVDKKGSNIDAPSTYRIVFSNITFGGACGSVQSSYLKGETSNNALTAGMKCTISAVLKRKNGQLLRNAKIRVKNDVWTTRVGGRTDSKGKVFLSFTALASGPYYSLLGPKITSKGYLACNFYRYDHMV